jgi:DNA repair protein RecO (recombination protein O)
MESSKILTVLTEKEGKLTVSARGAVRKGSKLAAAAQLLVYSEMTLYQSRDRWTMTEARSVEQFRGLRGDVPLLALGSYFAEAVEAVADEDCPGPALLPLLLNSLYALSEGIKPPEHVKPAFELRLMAASGYEPSIARCCVCGGREPARSLLDLGGGTLRCEGCDATVGGKGDEVQRNARDGARDTMPQTAPLSLSALKAARYITSCDGKKLFSFKIGKDAQKELSEATERYLLAQLDRGFRTLEYYKQIRG